MKVSVFLFGINYLLIQNKAWFCLFLAAIINNSYYKMFFRKHAFQDLKNVFVIYF